MLYHIISHNQAAHAINVFDCIEGNPIVTGGFPSRSASTVENVSMSWCDTGNEVTGVIKHAQIKILIGKPLILGTP